MFDQEEWERIEPLLRSEFRRTFRELTGLPVSLFRLDDLLSEVRGLARESWDPGEGSLEAFCGRIGHHLLLGCYGLPVAGAPATTEEEPKRRKIRRKRERHDHVVLLYKAGYTVRDIAAATEVGKRTIERDLAELREEGRIE